MKVALRLFATALVVAHSAMATLASAAAPAGRYSIANGTVFDTKTKLTWQQVAAQDLVSWSDAKTYCAGLGTSLGGTGWRVPTIKELQTIVDFSRAAPAIDSDAFPSTLSRGYWASSTGIVAAGGVTTQYRVDFSYGYASTVRTTETNLVRCVR